MRLSNNYQKTFSDKFVNAFRFGGLSVIVFITLTVVLYTAGQLGYMKPKVAQTLAILTGFLSISSIYKFLVFLFKLEPSEKSVEINDTSLTIDYPLPKTKREILFKEIDFIKYNKLSNRNEARIGLKKDKNEFGMDYELIEINSVDLSTLKTLSDKKQIPLAIGYELEEKPTVKVGLLAPRIALDDIYVVRKNMDNREIEIDESEWIRYASTNTKIKFLGQEERLNWKDNEGPRAPIQYTLSTIFGTKSLDFMAGQLGIAYEKGKTPTEIIQISKDLNCEYKNIMDVKK